MKRKSLKVSDGTKLSYLEGGSGKPLLMIPGWSQSAEAFGRQFDDFCKRRRVIALDMRGHGQSQKTEGGYRIQRLAKDLFDAFNVLDLKKPDIVSHSMGCSIIWSYLSLFAKQQPLGKLVLIDQAPVITAQANFTDEDKANFGCLMPDFTALNGFEGAVIANQTAAGTKEILRGMFRPTVAESDLDWFASENINLPRAHAAHLLHDHCVLDWRSEIQAIRNKCLVVGGEASIFSAQSQRWIAAQIPGAELEIFSAEDGGSHFMFFENPEKFNKRVLAFLGAK